MASAFLSGLAEVETCRLENKDSRRYPRLNAEFTVQLDLSGATFRERAYSLGGGGLFITTTKQLPLQLGTEMAVRFRPAKHLPLIDAKAKVCYLAPGRGAAIEFTAINDDDRRRLLGFIHNKAESTRKHSRAPLATQISCQESMSLAFSREISAGGMFIETKNPLPVGSRVTLRFNLSDTGDVMVLMGEVGYHAGNLGMGIRFVEATPEDLQRIEDYVSSTSTERPPGSRKTK
jgi:c-di-GMP-binding flagellar brake protein YcgR